MCIEHAIRGNCPLISVTSTSLSRAGTHLHSRTSVLHGGDQVQPLTCVLAHSPGITSTRQKRPPLGTRGLEPCSGPENLAEIGPPVLRTLTYRLQKNIWNGMKDLCPRNVVLKWESPSQWPAAGGPLALSQTGNVQEQSSRSPEGNVDPAPLQRAFCLGFFAAPEFCDHFCRGFSWELHKNVEKHPSLAIKIGAPWEANHDRKQNSLNFFYIRFSAGQIPLWIFFSRLSSVIFWQ